MNERTDTKKESQAIMLGSRLKCFLGQGCWITHVKQIRAFVLLPLSLRAIVTVIRLRFRFRISELYGNDGLCWAALCEC